MGGMIPPFYIHGSQFEIVPIYGEEPPLIEHGWKATIAIDPGETYKLTIKFNNKGIICTFVIFLNMKTTV